MRELRIARKHNNPSTESLPHSPKPNPLLSLVSSSLIIFGCLINVPNAPNLAIEKKMREREREEEEDA